MNRTKQWVVSLVAAITVCFACVTVSAQEDEIIDEIIVVGYAASLQRAIAQKRNSDVVSDGISAEEIGKFPQENLAESIQHVTGVQISRNQGEGEFISVRGLEPKFTATTYNGRLLPSGSGTRAFDYGVLTGDFVSSVRVLKSPTANMLESGLAATVDISSVKPLDYGERNVVAKVAAKYDELGGGSANPQATFVYVDTFMDDRLGLSLGVDFTDRTISPQSFGTTGLVRRVYDLNGTPTEFAVTHIMSLNDAETEAERTSFIGNFQFRINDAVTLGLDTLISEYNQDFNQRSFWYNPEFSAAVYESAVLDGDGVARQLQASNLLTLPFGTFNEELQDLNSTALHIEWLAGDWTFNAEASYAEAEEQNTTIFVTGLGFGADLTYDVDADAGGPFSFGQPAGSTYDPLSTDGVILANNIGVAFRAPTTDEISSLRLDAIRELDWGRVSAVQFGIQVQNRKLESHPNSFNVAIANITSELGLSDPSEIVPNYFHLNPDSILGDYSGPAQMQRDFLTVDLDSYRSVFPIERQAELGNLVPNLGGTTLVEEETEVAYVSIDFDLLDDRVPGVLGLRYVRTTTDSAGFGPVSGATIDYGVNGGTVWSDTGLEAASNTYSEVLPSLNLNYEITDNLMLRFAAARVLQRPDMDQLAQANVVHLFTPPPPATDPNAPWYGSMTRGNPDLDPYISDQFDLSLEWYRDNGGLLAIGYFRKDVKNFVLEETFQMVFPVDIVDDIGGIGSQVGRTRDGTFTVSQPVNSEKVDLNGFEISYVQPELTALPGFWSNFGFNVGFTFIDAGELVVQEGTDPLPVTGVSEKSYSMAAFYESERIGVRAFYVYRDDWVVDNFNIFGDGTLSEAYGQLDLSADFYVSDNLSIYASVINALNEENIHTNRFNVNTLYQFTGQHYTLGFRYAL